MDIELKRSKLTAKIYDKEYSLTKPTVRQYETFTKAITANMGEATALDHMKTYLVKCGLPPEVLDDLEMEHLSELIQVISGTKKK